MSKTHQILSWLCIFIAKNDRPQSFIEKNISKNHLIWLVVEPTSLKNMNSSLGMIIPSGKIQVIFRSSPPTSLSTTINPLLIHHEIAL